MNRHAQPVPFGLTIVEVLIVLAIVGIMAGISLLSVDWEAFRLKSGAQNLRSSLMKARAEAVKTNTNASVDLLPESFSVVVQDTVQDTHTLDDDLTLCSTDLSPLSTDSISFTPMGRSSNAHVKISNAQNNFSILVNPAGKITIEGPDQGACQEGG
ncbi:MAG: GspH/FimT family pseudopilin [Desulfonatronovibrionaceae bacterium]